MDDTGVAFYQQSQVVLADLGHMNGLEARTEQPEAAQACQRAFAGLFDGLLHLEGGLVHVHMDCGIQLFGDYPDLLQVGIAHGIGRVGAERDLDARVVLEIAEQLDALADRLIGAAGAGNREVEDRNCDLCAYAAVVHAIAGDLGVEVHVREAGDATLELLGDGQVGAITYEGFIDPLGLGGPDVFFQPGHQGQVIGQAAKQAHCRVPVGVDQAGAEQHARQFAHFAGRQLQRRGPWPDKGNAPIADAHAMFLEHHASRFDRYQPGWQ
ncbi:hypothetical protein ALP39_200076 [Pseudomonas marginalis pv. marginalis]|nr:hypothetical protein ALP39_200076 [Pseudomonas marginalis pv. marginalis]